MQGLLPVSPSPGEGEVLRRQIEAVVLMVPLHNEDREHHTAGDEDQESAEPGESVGTHDEHEESEQAQRHAAHDAPDVRPARASADDQQTVLLDEVEPHRHAFAL